VEHKFKNEKKKEKKKVVLIQIPSLNGHKQVL